MINKINIGGVDYDIAGSTAKNKEWKPFAINRCIKPTSIVGARYYFPGPVRFSNAFYDEIYGRYPEERETLTPENDYYYLEHLRGSTSWEHLTLVEKGTGYVITNKIVTILDTPTMDNLDWIKIESAYAQSSSKIIDTDSPYLKIFNGCLLCVKPVLPLRRSSVCFSKYSSRKAKSARKRIKREGSNKFYTKKLWRKGCRGSMLMYMTKCRLKYWSIYTTTIGNHTDSSNIEKYNDSAPYYGFFTKYMNL